MSRLLSEKRIIAVDTTAGTAGAADYENGAVVVDSAASAVYVSDGTDWTEVVLGSDIVVSGDISGAANNDTVAGSLAAKTYTDDQIGALSIPADRTVISYEANGSSREIGTNGYSEIAVITGDTGISPAAIESNSSRAEIYNYSTTTYTITAVGGGGIQDIEARNTAGTIDILGGQKIVFAWDGSTSNVVSAYRSSI